jgi:secreted trypsin-like serine protease
MPGYITTQPILIGLTSAGGDGGCSSSVFHTNVQKYLGWIKAQI